MEGLLPPFRPLAGRVLQGCDAVRLAALAERAAAITGASPAAPKILPGIPFNLVLSTFLYFRAVQQVAVCYGYDVKNSAEELAYASDVFAAALNPRSDKLAGSAELLAKMMAIGELEATKAAAKKTWAAMVAQGGLPLFVAQLRALARKEAQTALASAGKKGLEQSLFKNILEQVGKRLALKNVQAAVPVVGGVFGALFDTSIMNTVVTFADICYRKRFILEKEKRVEALVNGTTIEVDASVLDSLNLNKEDTLEG